MPCRLGIVTSQAGGARIGEIYRKFCHLPAAEKPNFCSLHKIKNCTGSLRYSRFSARKISRQLVRFTVGLPMVDAGLLARGSSQKLTFSHKQNVRCNGCAGHMSLYSSHTAAGPRRIHTCFPLSYLACKGKVKHHHM